LLDYAFYVYWKQFEILQLGLALKLGLHPVAIAHLSAGTQSQNGESWKEKGMRHSSAPEKGQETNSKTGRHFHTTIRHPNHARCA
jgi:hypothetical protein